MKVTLETIYVSQNSLTKLINLDLPITTAYKFSRLVKKIREELATFEESRVALVKKYGNKEDTSGTVRVSLDATEEFSNELKKLLEVEIEVDFEPIPLSDLGDIKMSAVDISNLEIFFN